MRFAIWNKANPQGAGAVSSQETRSSAGAVEGEIPWTRQFGTGGLDAALAVAIDADGNILVAGHVGGALPGQTHAGDSDAFLRKYSP